MPTPDRSRPFRRRLAVLAGGGPGILDRGRVAWDGPSAEARERVVATRGAAGG